MLSEAIPPLMLNAQEIVMRFAMSRATVLFVLENGKLLEKKTYCRGRKLD